MLSSLISKVLGIVGDRTVDIECFGTMAHFHANKFSFEHPRFLKFEEPRDVEFEIDEKSVAYLSQEFHGFRPVTFIYILNVDENDLPTAMVLSCIDMKRRKMGDFMYVPDNLREEWIADVLKSEGKFKVN